SLFMSRGKNLFLFVVLCAALAGCRRHGGNGRVRPSPVAIELPGTAPAVSPELEPRLAAIGVSSFFVPALAARAGGPSVSFEALAPPAAPYRHRVYLEVVGRGDFDPALEKDPARVASGLWRALEPVAKEAWGPVAGVHLAWRVSASARGEALVLAELRRHVPGKWTLSAAIVSRIPDKSAKGWRSVAKNADFLVAETFGRGEDVDPAGFVYSASLEDAADFGTPVYAGYAPQGWGVRRTAGGEPRDAVPDSAMNELSEDRRFEFAFGDVLSAPDENVYVFTRIRSSAPPVWRGAAAPGDTITFRERRIADFTKALADGRAAPGKVVRLASLADDGRLLGFGVLEDELLGRPLEPKLVFSRAGGEENAVVAVNTGAEFSELSRINNWIDVRVDGARILDVHPGDFDRYLFLDARGRSVLSARARTIRFFENFVAPGEAMRTGAIRLSGPAALSVSAHLMLPDGRVETTQSSAVK
ncbi:MAG TPA: hypothetical protein VKH46_12375, partial [Thermoanaerobaculia bacterium]|nr:hypothetical protein [Thermoanaerobaculia bacterium]